MLLVLALFRDILPRETRIWCAGVNTSLVHQEARGLRPLRPNLLNGSSRPSRVFRGSVVAYDTNLAHSSDENDCSICPTVIVQLFPLSWIASLSSPHLARITVVPGVL